MKRLVLLLLVFVSLAASGQIIVEHQSSVITASDSVADGRHMKFMGIPIDGTLASFSTQLKEKGFRQIELFDYRQIKFFVGNFAGYNDCLVSVIAISPDNNRVVGVVITFPPEKTWSGLSSQYDILKRRLTSKYGEPATCVERFQTSVQPDDDFMRMHYVEMGQCEYESVFKLDEGVIALEISHKDGEVCDFNNVSLAYIDRANGEAMDQDAMDDL